MRKPLVMGNWKMHGTRASVQKLLAGLVSEGAPASVDVAVCPVFVHIPLAVSLCEGSALAVGAQDCSHMAEGAYTGEVAAAMLVDSGCQWVILGHSERRQYHGESDDMVAAKLAAALAAGIAPVLCVGETQDEREAGEAEYTVARQLQGALRGQASLHSLVIAYEPVWAIGTGLTATPEQAQAMHAFIRGQLEALPGLDAAAVRVVYGGSVKPDNAAELFAQEDIDGALVGGASLDAQDFQAIVAAAQG
ncbi:MAG TPA: triose-phosphate isomerase [Halieaceae bacterium]|nr:triose-phosphate isomerase [Haliea sp.]HAN68453.1 triose-phosphate isomerase [Halieaceae bacterium]MAA87620.1 triose-phosphate isomerase [Haliea sp.]MAD64572.1 triose-phosphate isomerase [Haliea sp.]MAY93070.1 triose-phosphate isomerase [Haliea sp.]MBK39727.1 triose-phosphate isomerase [Haliea sp.]